MNDDNEKQTITISKDKLVLLSKLLKDVKNEYKDVSGKEKYVYRLSIQRKLVESFFEAENIDKLIDTLKQKLYNFRLNQQLKEEGI